MKLLLTLLGLCISIPSAALAQDAPLVTVLETARKSNWYIRATLSDSARVEGRVYQSSDGLQIGERIVAASSVVQIERRFRRRGGALPGAAVAGAAAAWFAASAYEEDSGIFDSLFIVGATALGALAGLFIGEFVAPPEYEWELVR